MLRPPEPRERECWPQQRAPKRTSFTSTRAPRFRSTERLRWILTAPPAFTVSNFATVHTRSTGTGFGGPIHNHSGGAGMNVKSHGLLVGSASSARRLPHGAFIGSYQKGGFTAGGTRMGSVKGTFGTTGSSRV